MEVQMVKTETFADRLRRLRLSAGLSAYALAKKSGVTKQALYRLESGKNEPTWLTVQLLAAALGLDCRAFLDPALQTPSAAPARPRGRPKKGAGHGVPAPAKKARTRKGARR
jgi:transcriptional regulator with XRE-family HTH domain